jgi:uncharacterized membrane protein (DUF2068 family)
MSEVKQRHGCLSAWLVLMIVGNLLVAVAYLIATAAAGQHFLNAPRWTSPVLAVGAIVNVICAYALWHWKKWGFYGFIATAALAFAVNLKIGAGIFQSFLGLAGLAILIGVLNIGKENKGWGQLE